MCHSRTYRTGRDQQDFLAAPRIKYELLRGIDGSSRGQPYLRQRSSGICMVIGPSASSYARVHFDPLTVTRAPLHRPYPLQTTLAPFYCSRPFMMRASLSSSIATLHRETACAD